MEQLEGPKEMPRQDDSAKKPQVAALKQFSVLSHSWIYLIDLSYQDNFPQIPAHQFLAYYCLREFSQLAPSIMAARKIK